MRKIIATLMVCAALLQRLSGSAQEMPPEVRREFRGVWVATVANIDWPARAGSSTERQKQELIGIMERAAATGLNAVIFQVRPACDALYASQIEPWSEYLTGTQGKAPNPFYDPLEFAIAEAHKRGLELHAWFNPYRARHSGAKSPVAPNHVSKVQPQFVRTYGKHLWLDPGQAGVPEYTLSVIADVVRRYEIDGVHIDDYFYPYKEKDASGNVIEFPDAQSYSAYRARGGTLGRDDWRRQNVNRLVEQMYQTVKSLKPHVKFGISPFGIWRPGNPPQIRGFDAYAEIYADARTWLVNGWCDYFAPQLYWAIEPPAQSYPVLLNWWAEQNTKKRHLWPGNAAYRVGNPWRAQEIVDQVELTRRQPGATGNIHFSMAVFMSNRQAVRDMLARGPYAEPALVPASPWLDAQPPEAPELKVRTTAGGLEASWKAGGRERPFRWVVQWLRDGRWSTEILPGGSTARSWTADSAPSVVSVMAVSRTSITSRAAVWRIQPNRSTDPSAAAAQ